MAETPTFASSLARGLAVRAPVLRIARNFGLLSSLAGIVALAGCSAATTTVAKRDPVLGVKPSPRVVAMGKPIPKGGGVYKVGSAYQVASTTYSPLSNEGYSAVGVASWYGDAFHGRLTANGEVYDRNALSAAHPTLPLPSYVRVTNVANGRSVVVRVNDRGPFSRRRLVDVSAKTADLLDFRRAGTARVRLDYIGIASLKGSDDRKLLATYSAGGNAGPSAEQFRLASLVPSAPPTPAPPAPRLTEAPPTPPAHEPQFEPIPAIAIAASSPSSPTMSTAQRIASGWNGVPSPMPLAPAPREVPTGTLAMTPPY